MARWFARGTIGMTLAGAILISGCSIQDTSASGREAAASVDASVEASTEASTPEPSISAPLTTEGSSPQATESASVEAIPDSTDVKGTNLEPLTALRGVRAPDCYYATTTYRCVRLTFSNPLNRRIFIEVNGKELGRQTLNLGPGEGGDVTGYTGTWKDTDIAGDIEICNWPDGFNGGGWCPSRDNKKWKLGSFSARNPQIGKPCVQWRYEDCTDVKEGETYRTKDGQLEFTRLPDDSDYINFSVKIRYR